ncbi:DUF6520 family protein [Aestuariibaculum sp. M13]|uniref:DUF6520 family protein n=1 Tax=Aestuariibaculum sp. M13 TaxID=2967132 RepID=UPI002159EB49|nr:DUF6520 family protein [Aestuariibaculum sp. M13]MCR8668237.1 DUF6520 family protein [Aestuariibaculum sp. M13]
MKNSFLKIVLPALAIMLAVGLSFATETINSSTTGYYDDPAIPGVQEIQTDCTMQAGEDCLVDETFQVYATPALGTIPNNELHKN